mgnify:CR=1 FL=1
MAAVEVETGGCLLVRRRAVLVGLGLVRVPVLVVAQVLGMLTGFVPALKAAGFNAAQIRKLLASNPQEALTIGVR